MNKLANYIKPALLTVALFLFVAAANGAWAQGTTTVTGDNVNASNLGGVTADDLQDESGAGKDVITQVYNIIKFAYVFFYAIAVLLVAQAWMQFKQQKYDAMFASMGAALGLFLTPAIIDFLHSLGKQTAH